MTKHEYTVGEMSEKIKDERQLEFKEAVLKLFTLCTKAPLEKDLNLNLKENDNE